MAEPTRRIRPQDDPSSWSYYGAAHRYDVHGVPEAQAACERRMDRLVIERREDELRALTADGDRCAFIALIEILVDENRVDDLRAMAEAGDGRAHATLMELLMNQERAD
ncbi:hypothetical protein NE236_20340 [Actinoallomurus purpureus]|uniref:hypothetical protein n=1 Tax=Actinoallomurus purpureus TaxID=478114 RepID=UPI002091E7E9|nr:hypothetical protein [Actinoallomurus purpureus]MCO6007333.1 hypothetical protein [Actinoallomurus purpureus]